MSETEPLLEALRGQPSSPRRIDPSDTLLVRLNPARFASAAEHLWLLGVLDELERNGTRLLNSARGLSRAGSKAYLCTLPPGLRPRQHVVDSVAAAGEAYEELGPEVVLKPAFGSRGDHVARFAGPPSALPTAVTPTLRRGPLVLQEWMPEAACGDSRVVVIGGRPLIAEGRVVAVSRVPVGGDFRSNLSRGAEAREMRELTPAAERTLSALGPRLVEDGLSCVGVDLVGDRILEINVWAPGGLSPFERCTGVDPSTLWLETLLAC